jgi:hypothetical protein
MEYAGTYFVPDGPFPQSDTEWKQLGSAGCQSIVAGFLGLSLAGFGERTEIRYVRSGPNRYQWPLGDRSITCFVAISAKHPVHTSLEGLGGRPLPG